MTRRVIPEKKVTCKGMTITTGSDGKIEIEIPGRPHLELTHEECLHLSSLIDDVTKWHDED